MMKCDYCTERFVDSMNGLVEKTFHELIKHKKVEIN